MKRILIVMQLQDFEYIKLEEVWKIVFAFPFQEKITDIWKLLLGAVL